MLKNLTTLTAVAILCAACAGRPPTPVPVVQALDQQKDCLALTNEVNANNYQVSVLSVEQQNKRTQNVVAGVAGAILFWPALFAMDFQDAAGSESAALQSRQGYLAQLAAQRCAVASR